MKNKAGFFIASTICLFTFFECDCSVSKIDQWEECCPEWMITPNAGPCVSDGADFFLTADFIYWTAREEGLNFTNKMAPASSGTHTSSGKIFSPCWKFKPGYRIGGGLNYDHDGWDLYANYTWFHMRDTHRTVRSSSTMTPQDTFVQINEQSPSTSQLIYNKAHAWWHLNFEVVDLELGRNFYISRYLTLRPHFGLKGTWQKQKYHVLFEGAQIQTNDSISSTSKNKMDYWGVGIRSGLDAGWYFTRGFSLYGNLAITGLWEGYGVKRSDLVFDLTTHTGTVGLHTKYHPHFLNPVIEWEIGLSWETWFYHDDYHFALAAGWEEQVWFNQNQFIGLHFSNNLSDLILEGFTLKGRFDF